MVHWLGLIHHPASHRDHHQNSERLSINLPALPKAVVVVGSLQTKGRKIPPTRRRRVPGRFVKSDDVSAGHHIGKISLAVHRSQGHEIPRHQIWAWGVSKNCLAKDHGPRRTGGVQTVKALATVIEHHLDALLKHGMPRLGKEKSVLASRSKARGCRRTQPKVVEINHLNRLVQRHKLKNLER